VRHLQSFISRGSSQAAASVACPSLPGAALVVAVAAQVPISGPHALLRRAPEVTAQVHRLLNEDGRDSWAGRRRYPHTAACKGVHPAAHDQQQPQSQQLTFTAAYLVERIDGAAALGGALRRGLLDCFSHQLAVACAPGRAGCTAATQRRRGLAGVSWGVYMLALPNQANAVCMLLCPGQAVPTATVGHVGRLAGKAQRSVGAVGCEAQRAVRDLLFALLPLHHLRFLCLCEWACILHLAWREEWMRTGWGSRGRVLNRAPFTPSLAASCAAPQVRLLQP